MKQSSSNTLSSQTERGCSI